MVRNLTQISRNFVGEDMGIHTIGPFVQHILLGGVHLFYLTPPKVCMNGKKETLTRHINIIIFICPFF